MSSAAHKKASPPIDDPVLEAFARAPLGPPDPPEVRAAIREGQELGRFVSGALTMAGSE